MYKVVFNGYIVSVNNANVGEEISEEEYMMICEALKNKPTKDGYRAKLKIDLTWEMVKNPEAWSDDAEYATEADYLAALAELGVTDDEEG